MRFLLLFFIGIIICLHGFSQKADSVINSITELPNKYFAQIDKKISSVDEDLTKQTEKYLKKLQRQEDKLKQHLQKIDSSAKAAFANANKKYTEFSQKIKSKTAIVSKLAGGQYNSYIDSLGTSLNFLKQFNGLTDKVKEPLKNLEQLQDKLHQTEK